MTQFSEKTIISIVGLTNVGKSTLFNVITGQKNKAIVDSKAGTTADNVISLMELHGLGKIKLIDTAGIDENGILGDKKREKTKQAIDESDLIYSISVGLLLFIVACGVYFLVYGRVYQSALEKLLEEGDYSRKKKAKKGLVSLVTAVFWLATTAIYLFIILSNFVSNSKSWIIWPIAGVIFQIVIVIIESVEKKERKK